MIHKKAIAFISSQLIKTVGTTNLNFQYHHSYMTYSKWRKLRYQQQTVLSPAKFSTLSEPGNNLYVKSAFNNEIENFVSASEIQKYLQQKQLNVTKGHTCFIASSCPLCNNSNDRNNNGHLYVNMTTGWFCCNLCDNYGEWSDFVDNMNILDVARSRDIKNVQLRSKIKQQYNKGELLREYEDSKRIGKLNAEERRNFNAAFKMTGVKIATMDDYGFRFSPDRCLIVPAYDSKGRLSALKKFSEIEGVNSENSQYEPKSCYDACFGSSNLNAKSSEIIVLDNPFDMAAVKQNVPHKACISLLHGASSLSQHLLPFFEQFDRITFWFNNTNAAWETTKMFAKKLNYDRCSFVRPKIDQPSPLEALEKRLNVVDILKKAESLKPQHIMPFSSLREDILMEFMNAEKVAGVKWQRFPMMNQLLKGHRRGELTVFTGPTGAGKTTFMSEYSLDLSMQGVTTLWGSFEIRNVRLAKTMLSQFSSICLHKHLDEFDYWSDRFEHLPMYFMKFHGQEAFDKVLQTMSRAVYVYDIQHIVIDNLQFMMGLSSNNIDRYLMQDQIIGELRKFATYENCHVTLVMHPRKEKDGEELTPMSIFGGAKAIQEADNVLLLQSKRFPDTKKYIQVAKNRFDGALGIMPIMFDKDTYRFHSIASRQE